MDTVFVNVLRDLAQISYAKGENNLAYALILEASRLRPEGPVIKKRKELYLKYVTENTLFQRNFNLLECINKLNTTDNELFKKSIQSVFEAISSNANIRLIETRNRAGKKTHYHHFFGSCFLPIIECAAYDGFKKDVIYFMCSHGPLDYDVQNLIEILDEKIIVLEESVYKLLHRSAQFEVSILPSYDRNWSLGGAESRYSRALIKKMILDLCLDKTRVKSNNEKVVTIIERLAPLDAYQKGGVASGTERRSIPNLTLLKNELSKEFTHVNMASFEGMNLTEKVKLLAGSDILIIQFGAGMNNMWWLHKGAHVIEITPKHWLRKDNGYAYAVMADSHELNYHRVIQSDDHAPVDIHRIKNICVNIERNKDLRKGRI